MVYTLAYRVDVQSVQKAVALRDRLSAAIEASDAVDLLSVAQARDTLEFEVVGVNVTTAEVFERTVEAASADEARETVASPTMVVVSSSPLAP